MGPAHRQSPRGVGGLIQALLNAQKLGPRGGGRAAAGATRGEVTAARPLAPRRQHNMAPCKWAAARATARRPASASLQSVIRLSIATDRTSGRRAEWRVPCPPAALCCQPTARPRPSARGGCRLPFSLSHASPAQREPPPAAARALLHKRRQALVQWSGCARVRRRLHSLGSSVRELSHKLHGGAGRQVGDLVVAALPDHGPVGALEHGLGHMRGCGARSEGRRSARAHEKGLTGPDGGVVQEWRANRQTKPKAGGPPPSPPPSGMRPALAVGQAASRALFCEVCFMFDSAGPIGSRRLWL
jgi:hypothetical protein